MLIVVSSVITFINEKGLESMIQIWCSLNNGNFIEIIESLNTLTQIYFHKGFWGKDSKTIVSYQKT